MFISLVTGPYAERIFGDELGASKESFIKTNILEDFGGGHPDPNLTYAADLVDAVFDEAPGASSAILLGEVTGFLECHKMARIE